MVSYTFLDPNSICHKCFAPVLGGGVILGAIFTSFLYLSRRYITSFFLQGQLCGVIQEKRKRNQHHHFEIKEPDISYLDATNEISLTMFSDFSPFPVNLAPLTFFLWNPCLHTKLHGAPLVL